MAHRILSFFAIAVGLAVLGVTVNRSSESTKSNPGHPDAVVHELASVSSFKKSPQKLLVPASQVGEKDYSDSLWQSAYNVVHVVSTR